MIPLPVFINGNLVLEKSPKEVLDVLKCWLFGDVF